VWGVNATGTDAGQQHQKFVRIGANQQATIMGKPGRDLSAISSGESVPILSLQGPRFRGERSAGHRVRTASVSGSENTMKFPRRHFIWAAFTNTSRPNSQIDGDLDQLNWDMVGEVKSRRV
jgi:hypothetical protein